MNCQECSLLLLDYHFDTLEPHRRAEVAEHLLSCPHCRATLDKLKTSVPDQLAWPDEPAPESLGDKIRARIAQEPDLPRPTPIKAPPHRAPPNRSPFKALAAMALVGALGYGYAVSQRRVSMVAQLDGQQTLTPGGLSTLRMSLLDVETREPIANARVQLTLRGPDGKETVVFDGHSDRAGTLPAGTRLPDLPEGGYTLSLHASKGGEETTVTRPINLQRRYRVMVSSDKPMYQPSQVIHLRALAREAITGKPPEGRELTFVMLDPKGNKVGRKVAAVDRFGVASFDFPLADEILLGTWRVEAEMGEAKAALDLNVSRYSLPKFQVSVTTDKSWYKPGELVSGRIESRYFFGKPAGGAKVALKAGVFVDSFREIAQVQGMADEQGTYRFDLPIPAALPGVGLAQGAAAIDLSAEVTDSAGQHAQKHQGLTVASEDLSVTVVAEGGYLVPGIENRLLALVVRPDGEPVAGAVVSVPSATLDKAGVPTAITGEDGIAALAYTPRSDRRDLTVQVSAKDGAKLLRAVEISSDRLPGVVRTEKTLYTAGDTVRGEVLAVSPGGVLFLDAVRDGETFATYSLPIESGRAKFAFEIPAEVSGTVTLYAYTPGGEVKRARKTLFVGEPRSLQVSLTGDKESYQPGKPARINVKVVGDDGKPAAASVGLSVVDESVFALVSKEPAMLKAYFLLAEELAKPRYELDPARVIAEGARRDQAASMLFSQPRPDEVERFGQTSGEEIQRRASALVATQNRAHKLSWGMALLALGVFFEGALRFLFERLFKRFFSKWWRTGALLVGGGLGLVLKLDGAAEGVSLVLGLVPLVVVLAFEAIVWMFRGNWQLFFGGTVALGVFSMLFITVFGQNMRALFAASANALGGSLQEAPDFGMKLQRKRLDNFGEEAAEERALPDLFARLRVAERAGGKAPAPASAAEKAKVRVRSWFPETMFWSPSIITGADGLASVEIPTADSITSWRMSAVASGADGRLGVGHGALKVFQDFFVDVELPPALTVGDEVELPIAVHNYLSQPQAVNLEVEDGDWFAGLSPKVQRIELGAGEVRGVPLRLKATAFGKKTLTVWAFGSSLKDAVRREVEVRPNGVKVEDAVGGPLSANVRATARLPAGAIPGSEKVLLRIFPGILAAALEGIEGTLRQPYGCFEQTSSATYPNALVLDYLRRSGKSKPELEARALEYLQQGYQRLLSFEVNGGGFEWFGRAPANQVLTAYGLLEFADMARVYQVDPAVIRRTQEWLVSKQRSDGSFEPDRQSLSDGLYRDQFSGRLGATAYITWALVESGYRGIATDRALGFLQSRSREISDAYTLSLVSNALLAAGLDAQPLVERLISLAVQEKGGLRFPAGGRTAVYSAGPAADVETSSLASLALFRTGQLDRARSALDYLLATRSPSGAWPSTQSTVLALRSLLSASAGGSDPNADGSIAIDVGGQKVEPIAIRPETSDLIQTVDLTRFAKPGVPLSVELALSGKARAQYQLVTIAYVPKPVPEEALALKVDFDRVTLAPDDTLTARATATWKKPQASGMVMLALGIPPGFEVEPSSVAQLVAQGKVGKFTLTGKELLLYVDALRPFEPVQFAYQLRAKFPVRAQAPSSLAYLYYQPEVRTQSAAVQLVVRR